MFRIVRRAVAGVPAALGLIVLASFVAPMAGAVPADAAPATAAPAKATVGFGIQPAAHGRPDARHNLSYSVTPGARLRDEVAIVNIGTRPLKLDLAAVDAAPTGDGSFALMPYDGRSTQLGAWIAISARAHRVTVPARTSRGPSFVVVPISLSVPRDATPGDHGGGLAVSLVGTAVNRQGVRVKLDQRVALRVYTRVSGPLRPKLAVDALTIDYTGPALNGNPFATGTARVRYVVRNTGNVSLGATQKLTVSSWLGGSVTVSRMTLVPPLLPGSSMIVTRIVRGVFPGLRVSADVTLHPVAPAGAGDPKLGDVIASTSTWAWPWILIALVALLLLAVAAYVWRRRSAAARGGSHRPVRAGQTVAPESRPRSVPKVQS